MHGWVSMVRVLSCKPNICVSWSTSELRVRLVPWNWFMPSSKTNLTDRSKAVLLLWVIFAIDVSCLSCCLVCSLLPCDYLLGTAWPLSSRLRCFIVFLSLSHVVFWVRCGTWLYRFQIVPPFRTLWLVSVVLAAWSLHASWTFFSASSTAESRGKIWYQ